MEVGQNVGPCRLEGRWFESWHSLWPSPPEPGWQEETPECCPKNKTKIKKAGVLHSPC